MSGTTFTIDVPVKAAQAAKAASDLGDLETKLKAAGAASVQASDAVRAGEATYKAAASTFDAASKAVERIGVMADAQRGKLEAAMKAGDEKTFWRTAQAIQELGARQEEARAKSESAKAALDAATTSLDSLRTAATAASEAQAQIGAATEEASSRAAAAAKAVVAAEKNQQAAFEATRKALLASQREIGEAVAARVDASIKAEQKGAAEAKKAAADAAGTGKANEAAEAFGKIGGPVGALGTKVFGLREGWNKMKATFGDKAPFIAGAAGVAALTIAVVALGVAAVISVAKFGAWAVGLADTARSQAMLSAGIAKSVEGGELLQSKIDSLTSRLPLTSDELRSMSANLAATGLRGQALATELENAATKAAKLKFGPDFAKQMVSTEQLSKRLTLGFSKIFGGLKIDGLLEKLSSLVELFEANSATANAIKVVFESLFQPAIDGIEAFIPKVVSAFIQLQIWALQGLIAIKPYGFVFREAASAAELVGVSVGVAFGVLAAVAAHAALQVAFVFTAIKTVRDAIESAKLGFASLAQTIAAIDLGQMGRDMMKGLADGITSGAGAVVDAMKNAATGAVNSAKKALGIASPSRVLAEQVGVHIPGGIAMGVDDASGEVEAATQAAVDATTSVAPSGANAAAASPVAPSSAPNFTGATFIFNGVAGAEEAISRFQAMLTMTAEELAALLGGGEVPNAG